MSFLQVFILTIFSVQLIEINAKSLDNPLTFKKLQLTSPLFQSKINLSSPNNTKQSITLETVKPIEQNRNPKFLYTPSFLTGLGIGSLASSAALSSSPPILSSNPESLTRRHSRPMNMFIDANQSLPKPQIPLPQHYLNVYDPAYPYVAFSANLFEQSLRSIYNILESLKMQLASKEISSEPSKVIVKNDKDEINNSAEETSHVKIISKDDRNHLGVVNRSILKDVIKESIEEINKDLEQRQAVTIRAIKNTTSTTTTPSPPTMTKKNTENISTNNPMTVTPTPTTASPIITTSKPGYYGGNPQPVHNVNLIHGFPSTEYGHPHNEIHYGPPPSTSDHGHEHGFAQIYPHDHGFGQNHPYEHGFEQNHPHDHGFGLGHGHDVFDQNYYHSEPYYGAQENHSPTGSFSSPSTENWPIYPPYARAFKFSGRSIPKTNTFKPSKLI